MRPIVLIAVVGAAAVLGGVVGAGVMRGIGTGAAKDERVLELAARVQKLEARAARSNDVDPLRGFTTQSVETLRAMLLESPTMISNRRWWCGTQRCTRTEADCEASAGPLCNPQRIAWCPSNLAKDTFGCSIDETSCAVLARVTKTKATCIGVE